MGGSGTEVGAALRQHKTSRCQADPELSLYLREKREGERRGEEVRKGREEEGRRRKGEVGQLDNHTPPLHVDRKWIACKMLRNFLAITLKNSIFYLIGL